MEYDSRNNSIVNNTNLVASTEYSTEKYIEYSVMAMICINMIGVGGHVDGDRLVVLMKKPLLVSIAMVIRFTLMPAVGLGLVELFHMRAEEEMSILSIVLAPHEGIGCLFTLLFEGDLTQAVAIELVNNFSTSAFLPIWAMIYESRIYCNPGHIQLPMTETFILLGYMSIAAAFGYLLRTKYSNCYDKYWQCLPSVTISTIAFILGAQFYINRGVFALTTVQNICNALLLAISGFVVASLVSFLLRQSAQRALVFCLENGLRTTYITGILAAKSFTGKSKIYGNVIPTYTSVFTIWTALCTVLVSRYLKTKSAFEEYKRTSTKCEHEKLNTFEEMEEKLCKSTSEIEIA